MKNESIKSWYLSSFPTDELGKDINSNITFQNALDCLLNREDMYEFIGVFDSIVRERIFHELSVRFDSYDVIYSLWLSAS